MSTTQEITVNEMSRPRGVSPATFRLAADLADMIGGPIDYKCRMGSAADDIILQSVELHGRKIRIISKRPNGDTHRAVLCSACKVSAVVHLDGVTP